MIELIGARRADGDPPRRLLCIDNDGRIGWVGGLTAVPAFQNRRMAEDFRRHRMGPQSATGAVAHTVH